MKTHSRSRSSGRPLTQSRSSQQHGNLVMRSSPVKVSPGRPQSATPQKKHRSRVPVVPHTESSAQLRRSRSTLRSSQGHYQISLHNNQQQHFRRAETMSDAGSVASSRSRVSSEQRERYDPAAPRKGHEREREEYTNKVYDDTPRKPDKYSRTKAVIEDLRKAIGHDKKIAAVQSACQEFDHWDEHRHHAEYHYGAANVLSLVLSMTDNDDEIHWICAAIEMVFRGSNDTVYKGFHDVGAALVPLLLRLLERGENGNLKHADLTIMNITKTFLYFSRVPTLRVPLSRHQGILDLLVRVATSILNADCRVVRMRIVANLANCEENKIMMFEHRGMMQSMLRIATFDLSDKAREYASAALMDIASASANQVPMAKNDKLLGCLVKLAVTEEGPEAREYAITALQNLAFAKESRLRLVTYGSGVILEALKKAVSTDPNGKARRRAAGALTNLVCEETAEHMGSHKGLLHTLASISAQDVHADVQKRSVLALTKLSTNITVDMSCYNSLLDALVVAATNDKAETISAVLRVKAREPENRESMGNHSGVIDALCKITSNEQATIKDRDNAMRAIMHLTNENANRKVMCRRGLLDALVMGASLEGIEREEMRDSAILAIERLATEVSNRQYMARHEGLIVAVAKATERECKVELSGVSDQAALLAKPLLMSLLVSM